MYRWVVRRIDRALLRLFRCVAIPREWDNPVDEWNERHGERAFVRGPAHFAKMTEEQLRDWPRRDAIHWIATKVPIVLVVVIAGPLVATALSLPWPPVLAMTGLALDVLGVWWLAGNILISDEEANRFSSWGALGKADLTAKRDRRRARFSLIVITLGFMAQALSPLVALAEP